MTSSQNNEKIAFINKKKKILYQEVIKNYRVYLPTTPTQDRIWHKVNFKWCRARLILFSLF